MLPYQVLATLVLFWLAALAPVSPQGTDYSKEAIVIQSRSTQTDFSSDGTWRSIETGSILVQSDAGVRQLGVLSFSYDRDSQQLAITYLRVRKPDGRVVETPDSATQDISSGPSRSAPSYSDLREKQIPVKALGLGDVIEYQTRLTQVTPEIPGQFWFTGDFITNVVVLKETLQIGVPADKYVKVVSPTQKPKIREEPGRKIYTWETAQLQPTQQTPDQAKRKAPDPHPAVQITTFKSWEEVGRWYHDLEAPRAAVTPAIQAKADELTKGLSTETAKAHAIYDFVSTKFRYVSLSFGVGRYQPHMAQEVLENQYGDCKDKHTLFAALLKAEGIDASTALVGSEVKLDPDVPSPAQFNHVIAAIPDGKEFVWLDTTPEVAPYGLLEPGLRDKKVLLIPASGPASIVTTPAESPFLDSQTLDVEATLNASGTLSAHFDYTTRGDVEFVLRSAFRQVPQANWLEMMQQIVRANGFAGTVSNLVADNPDALDKPFHYAFDYVRPDYSDWHNQRTSPPLPPMLLPLSADAEKPAEPLFLGSRGEMKFCSRVKLPESYSAELPSVVKTDTGFASYESSSSLKDGVLETSRRLVIKQAKIQPAAWDAYKKFAKEVGDDHDQLIELNGLGASADGNSEAAALVNQAAQAGRRHDTSAALDDLKRAERLNPTQRGLWATYGALYLSTNEPEKGMAALRKEIELHPDDSFAYGALAQAQNRVLHQPNEAIETLKSGLKVAPDDAKLATFLAHLLVQQKRYEDATAILKPIVEKDKDPSLQTALAEALLRGGHREEGEAVLAERIKNGDALAFNDAAYYLADTNTDLPLAHEYAEKAVSQLEEKSSKLALPDPKEADFTLMRSLSAAWDTLGWVEFRKGDFKTAETYVGGAWDLSQRGVVGDHLGQIYLAEDKKQSAVHTWQLALAADSSLGETRERLRQLGAADVPLQPAKRAANNVVTPAEELGRLRSTNVPALAKQEASAEFFILFSSEKPEAVQFISGSESLKQAGNALKAADFRISAPDGNTEKFLRRGILSCSTYTKPSCQFVMLLPAVSRSVPPAALAADIKQPTLLSKTEPQYSPAALQAKTEGTVLLALVVDKDGAPRDITVLRSLGYGLDEKAKESVSKWRFRPGTQAGVPVATKATVEVTFRLENDQQ